MVRSTRILHRNVEYLIQEQGGGAGVREAAILARPGQGVSKGADRGRIIKTNHGEWIPIAFWKGGRLRILDQVSGGLRPDLEAVMNQYLHARASAAKGVRPKRYYYIDEGKAPAYTISRSHPHGLAVRIFCRKKTADEALSERGEGAGAARVRWTSDLKRFLVRAADDGFAGAVLDDREPVYFCLDRADDMVFLRLSMNDEEEVEESLLQEDGSWKLYEGEGEIDFFMDQQSTDGNMVRLLGEIPFLGHEEMEFLWTVEDGRNRGAPYVLAASEGPFEGLAEGDTLILFNTRKSAMDFILDRELYTCEAVRVDALKEFLRDAAERRLGVLFEPFNHRAAGGVLWLNGDEVILDSFSGFWKLGEDGAFRRA